MGGDRDMEPGRPVEPGEARAHGSDPEAVRVNREGERDLGGGERHVGRTEIDERRVEPKTAGGVRTREHVPDVHRERGTDRIARRDSTRWGPIWAGLITALTTFLLLQLLAIGTGLQDIGPGTRAGGGDPWVPAVIGLIAFFIGGWWPA